MHIIYGDNHVINFCVLCLTSQKLVIILWVNGVQLAKSHALFFHHQAINLIHVYCNINMHSRHVFNILLFSNEISYLFIFVLCLLHIRKDIAEKLILFQYGEIEEMNVCDNLGDHLVGNVYVKVNIYIYID